MAEESPVNEILQTLIPLLLKNSQSALFFPGRWRAVRENLENLSKSLSEALSCPNSLSNPLFLDLIPPLLTSLRSLSSISDRCRNREPPGGKLLLQSDLAIAAASLSLRLSDLDLLLRSELLLNPRVSAELAVVLYEPRVRVCAGDFVLFVRDLFARLRIGGASARKKALDSLLSLFAGAGEAGGAMTAKIGALVAGEGDVAALVRLMDAGSETAAEAVCFLAVASEVSRTAVFEEGGLGPLLRLLELGPPSLAVKAAAAIEVITADSSSAWAVQAYAGVPILVNACATSRHPIIRSAIAGCLRNVAAFVLDLRPVMAEEGGVPVLVSLLNDVDGGVAKKAVQCISFLAADDGEGDGTDDSIRERIIRDGGLRELMQLLPEVGSDLAEHVLRAILGLSSCSAAAEVLSLSFSSCSPFVLWLTEMIKRGNSSGAALVLEVGLSEEAKRAMAGAMSALVKMLELQKLSNVQESAAAALILLLSSRSNQREMAKDEKSLIRIVELLDPAVVGVRKELVVGVVTAVAGAGTACQRRLAAAGACAHLKKLAEMDVAGARKALQRVSGSSIRSFFSIPGRKSDR